MFFSPTPEVAQSVQSQVHIDATKPDTGLFQSGVDAINKFFGSGGSGPTSSNSSKSNNLIMPLLLLGLGGIAIYYFLIREKSTSAIKAA